MRGAGPVGCVGQLKGVGTVGYVGQLFLFQYFEGGTL